VGFSIRTWGREKKGIPEGSWDMKEGRDLTGTCSVCAFAGDCKLHLKGSSQRNNGRRGRDD